LGIARAAVEFVERTTTGFTASGYSNRMLAEIQGGCVAQCRSKPEKLQRLGRILLERPDHRGVADFLAALRDLIRTEDSFGSIKIDHTREFADAMSLAHFDGADQALAEIARRRAHSRQQLPSKALSTIHKAKGLEFDHVVLAGCDRVHFSNTEAARAKMYVALSRATKTLALMVSRVVPTPLFLF